MFGFIAYSSLQYSSGSLLRNSGGLTEVLDRFCQVQAACEILQEKGGDYGLAPALEGGKERHA
ncbi:hypothetical protein [Archaeoglobus sulfaticallidus]|uniref:hypothetical protein n=1 Tax=Archaeoglobus sulfaticallidus TaxID=1316941 RepID=UPI001181AE23|nr:hypothetical protein [Archaeoglobus sulfaticallidus]